MLGKPLLIIVNGLPGAGKTTLARRIAEDLSLPIFSRDGIYEQLYDALDCHINGLPPMLGSAAFSVLYHVIGSVLAAHHSVIIEGYFGRPELRAAELLRLQRADDFEPFQIMCKVDGAVLLQRFLGRTTSETRHISHPDLEWLKANKPMLLQGQLEPLPVGGELVEMDMTTSASFDYKGLLQRICQRL